jgi:hypothetical protein
MTIDLVAPHERSLVRLATPYLEVETKSSSSLDRTIMRKLAQTTLAAKRKKPKTSSLVPSRGRHPDSTA